MRLRFEAASFFESNSINVIFMLLVYNSIIKYLISKIKWKEAEHTKQDEKLLENINESKLIEGDFKISEMDKEMSDREMMLSKQWMSVANSFDEKELARKAEEVGFSDQLKGLKTKKQRKTAWAVLNNLKWKRKDQMNFRLAEKNGFLAKSEFMSMQGKFNRYKNPGALARSKQVGETVTESKKTTAAMNLLTMASRL